MPKQPSGRTANVSQLPAGIRASAACMAQILRGARIASEVNIARGTCDPDFDVSVAAFFLGYFWRQQLRAQQDGAAA